MKRDGEKRKTKKRKGNIMQVTDQLNTENTETVIGVEDTPEDASQFDVGNFGGMGLAGGGIILLVMFLLNWFMSSKKPTVKRIERYKKKKEESSAIIVANDEKQDVLKIVVEQKEKLSDDSQKKIDEIIDTAANGIQEVLKEKDTRVTVNRIINRWKG